MTPQIAALNKIISVYETATEKCSAEDKEKFIEHKGWVLDQPIVHMATPALDDWELNAITWMVGTFKSCLDKAPPVLGLKMHGKLAYSAWYAALLGEFEEIAQVSGLSDDELHLLDPMFGRLELEFLALGGFSVLKTYGLKQFQEFEEARSEHQEEFEKSQ